MTTFQIISIILTLASIGGWLNHRYTRLPATVGHMAFALLVSVIGIILHKLGIVHLEKASSVVAQIDFSEVLLHGMLSFLLFAGALHINFADIKKVGISVSVLSTFGVVVAAFITGTVLWYAAAFINFQIPYIYCLLFGALISPTDPIAVLALLKQVGVSKEMYTRIGGESLFNDGIGIVLFLTLLGIALGTHQPDAGGITILLIREVFGGLVLGASLGWITYAFLRPINDHNIEILLTLALVTGGYALAEYIHVSAPICMAVAGLVVGNHSRNFGMSELSRERLDEFWELVDEVFNAILFMLIGLTILVIAIGKDHIVLGFVAIMAVLVGRFISVAIPITLIGTLKTLEKGTIPLLTWGGLRGGISIAMALSLPPGPEKDIILPVTYIVVLFSVLVQGLTFKKLIRVVMKTEVAP